jgi:hypothetical protein
MEEADSAVSPGESSPGVPERELTLYTAPAHTTPPEPMPQPLKWQGVQHESDVAGPSIGGAPSWIETPQDGYFGAEGLGAVVWKLPDGDWAVLDFRDGADDGRGSGIFSRANVIRIAESVTQSPTAVAVPFRIEGALAQADVTTVRSSSSNGTNLQAGYWLFLTFREGEAQIDVSVRNFGGPAIGLPGQTCGPANAKTGVSACVAVHGTLPPALAASGAHGLLDDVHLLDQGTTAVIP